MFLTRTIHLLVFVCSLLVASVAATSTPLVTGNGFGFAVVSPETAMVTKFYAHPYSFSRPDARDPLSEGIETANFVKSLGWGESAKKSSADYVEDSHVIRIRNEAGEGHVFMPFGLKRNTLIVTWESNPASARSGHWNVEWSHPVKSKKVIRVPGSETQVLRFVGISETLLLIPIGKPASSQGKKQYISTNLAWALISLDGDRDVERATREFYQWRAGLAPSALEKREIAEVERWRVQAPAQITEKEVHLWRQSEMLLRMGQSREPNREGRYSNGLIVACLPDGGWFMPWVRDMAYAAVALVRMGHREEARAAILAYFNARPTGKMKEQTGGMDYQVSVVRYFGDGSEEPFFTNEGSTNIEFDNWGLVLWLLGEYLDRYDDSDLLRAHTYRGPLYESARDYVVKPLLANLEKHGDGEIVAADTSIWEERQKDRKHFAYSTAIAIVGLRDFAEIARKARDKRTQDDLLFHVTLLEKGFNAAFVRQGKLRGTLEEGVKNDIDGALLAVINFGLVTDPAIVRSTVDRMELLKVASGGYRRVRGTYTDPAIYEYWCEQQEFLFVDFMLAEVLRNMGRNDEADAIVNRIVDKSAADQNLIPEMYVAEDCKLFHGAVGDPTGARPMVGYGAGVYVLDILQRGNVER